mmetsp:Transcript_2334/g.4784  ORF Transcript_2334/g.4784 Transcript_2334/m.4784 type:complete len:142 (-) Transcript_2334:18-443(-)
MLAAKRRVEHMDVVIVLEWLHLSGPLLCVHFGWCHPDVLDDVAVPGDACDGRATLAEVGLHAFIAELEDRFKMDTAVYEHAKAIARRQLQAVGVTVLPEHCASSGGDEACAAANEAPRKVCRPPGETNRNVDKKKCRVRPQ